MTDLDKGLFFSSFNARALNPDQVAATFVPSDQFARLCQRQHTVVLGPRGSGKTTLLKMLQQPALESWMHPDASRYVSLVDFTGVFIATDISWGEQLASLGYGQLDVETQQLLANASFTTHILRSVSIAMRNRVKSTTENVPRQFRRTILTEEGESAVVKEIAASWYVQEIVPTLAGLQQGLTRRLAFIRELASKEVFLGSAGRGERLGKIPFLHLHFLQSAAIAIETFDYKIGEDGAKWGLLFDELEIAPKSIQANLMAALRSVDDRFLFKLALNPFTDNSRFLSKPTSAAPDQDFEEIALWYAEKRDALKFCDGLWDEVTHSLGLGQVSPLQVFGKSQFDSYPDDRDSSGSAYGPGSRWSRKFASLWQKDPTFRSYLNNRGINPRRLDKQSAAERAAEIRKIAPIVAIRDFFLRKDEDKQVTRLRSRKSLGLYAGAESVFAITEGNPRWFLGLMRSMLGSMDIHAKLLSGRIVPPAKQGEEMLKSAQRFAASLRTIPVESSQGVNSLGVLSLVRKIGSYFNHQAVREPFRPEPPGSFTVDANAAESIIAALGQALNAGAIVYVPDDDGQLILASLRGKRFRLSYLLAPLYEFPIRLGASISLGTIINRTATDSGAITQNQLFEVSDETEV
jgi:hypothetical protein